MNFRFKNPFFFRGGFPLSPSFSFGKRGFVALARFRFLSTCWLLHYWIDFFFFKKRILSSLLFFSPFCYYYYYYYYYYRLLSLGEDYS